MLARIIAEGIRTWVDAERRSDAKVGADRSGRLGTPQLPVFVRALELIHEHARAGTHATVTTDAATIRATVTQLNAGIASGPLSDGTPLGYAGKAKYVPQGWEKRFAEDARAFQAVEIDGTPYYIRLTVANRSNGKGKVIAVQPYGARAEGAELAPEAPMPTEPFLGRTTVWIDWPLPQVERFSPSGPSDPNDAPQTDDELRADYYRAIPLLSSDFLRAMRPVFQREITIRSQKVRAVGSALLVILLAALITFSLPVHDLQAQVIEWVRRVLTIDVPGLFSDGKLLAPETFDELERLHPAGHADVVRLRDPNTGEFIEVTDLGISMKLRAEHGASFLRAFDGMVTGEMVRSPDDAVIPSNISLPQHGDPREGAYSVIAIIPAQRKVALRSAHEAAAWSATVEGWNGTREVVPAGLMSVEVGSRRGSLVAFLVPFDGRLPPGRHGVRAYLRGPDRYREVVDAVFDVGPERSTRTELRHNEMFGLPARSQPGPEVRAGTWDVGRPGGKQLTRLRLRPTRYRCERGSSGRAEGWHQVPANII